MELILCNDIYVARNSQNFIMTSDIIVVMMDGIPGVGVGVAACLVASKCSGLMVVQFRM
jgi:hypothetical protein